jgi:hypothetical protein
MLSLYNYYNSDGNNSGWLDGTLQTAQDYATNYQKLVLKNLPKHNTDRHLSSRQGFI